MIVKEEEDYLQKIKTHIKESSFPPKERVTVDEWLLSDKLMFPTLSTIEHLIPYQHGPSGYAIWKAFCALCQHKL
jgi:hypothetical protein